MITKIYGITTARAIKNDSRKAFDESLRFIEVD
jgi:hypothetical protein